MDGTAINDFADVKAVLEQMGKCAGAKTNAAPDPAVDQPICFRAHMPPVEVLDQGANGAQLEITGKDGADSCRFFRHHDNLLVGDPVTQRQRSADPDAL